MSLALHYWMGDLHHCSGPRLRNDLYCVEWDIKLYFTIPSSLWHDIAYLCWKCR